MSKSGCLVSKWWRFKARTLCLLYLPHLPSKFHTVLNKGLKNYEIDLAELFR